MTDAPATAPLERGEVQAISLVTAAHFLSHFYQFVLPPVFGLMAVKLNVGFTELGLAITVFSVATGLSQTPAGFLVDRMGAAKLLALGVGVLGGAVALYGFAPSYWALLPLVAIGGVANSIFHPADFAILSGKVRENRIGRAFSFHAVSGNLGWAAAPAAMLGLSALFDVTMAFLVVGLAGVALSVLLALNAGRLSDDAPPKKLEQESVKSAAPRGGSTKDGMALLLSRAALMLFAFQLVYAMGFAGIRNFTVVALPAIWGVSAEVVAGALTGYLLAASVGNMVGGWLADKTGNPGRVFTFSIITLAVIIASLGAVPMSAALLTTALLTAGVLQGSLLPARDMLVRQIAPPGQIGKLFGFTSSGLALGNAITPALFGWVMDNADPRLIFYGSAGFMAVALFTYVETRRQAPQSR
jgi:FSR family fosmidomycin resistance protein-like MFS transporter